MHCPACVAVLTVVATALVAPTATPARNDKSAGCNVRLKGLKTLSDPQRKLVNLHPTNTTVATINALTQPPAERDERAEIIAHMRVLATTGTGTTAIQAARYLDEVARQEAQWVNDQGLLALLSRAPRKCIAHVLRYEPVPQDLAIEAWVVESPSNESVGEGA
jgi:hypothetical protein